MTDNAYQDLKSFERFEQIADLSQFAEVDDSWSVIISDIRGSTKAIEAGRYKDVNLIGAATIVAIRNSIQMRDFPFVFGGDGASVLLPSDVSATLREPLIRLQKMALANFGLELRVAIIPVHEVRARGGKILLSKYKIAPETHLAMIQGGGLRIADELAKSPEGAKFLLRPESSLDETPPDLASLSCRWAPFKNRNGVILSVLIQSQDLELTSTIYRDVLAAIAPIFEIEASRPVSEQNYRTEPLFKTLWREYRLNRGFSWRKKLDQILIPVLYTRLIRVFPNLPAADRYQAYLKDTMVNSDYKKLDDTLRMVLDCSPQQEIDLRELLEGLRLKNLIYYGIHRSDSALMTCLMEGLGHEQHIHFIDGANGGYAMAAKEMKKQILENQVA